MPFVVASLYPAVTVAVMLEMVWSCFLQTPAKTIRQLLNEPIESAVIDRIFEAGMFPDGTIPVIALDHHCFLRDIDHLLR
ncbi:hypothetical protein D3C77_465590 [compost metagenome]